MAAALYGGLTIGVLDAEGAVVRRLDPPPGLRAVVLVPEGFSGTLESRAVLPREVSRADAVFNTSRCALLAADLALGRLDGLAIAMQDRLHQPQRGASQFPYLEEAIAAAVAAGAYGAALSGSGSSVLALASPEHEVAVAAALQAVARDHQPDRPDAAALPCRRGRSGDLGLAHPGARCASIRPTWAGR